jgi:hypothetical protein
MSDAVPTDDLDKFIGWRGTLPRGWVQLPLSPTVDPDEWARSWHARAAEGVEWEEGEAGPDVAVAMLAHFVRLVRGRLDPATAAPLALALVPNVMDRVLAVATAAAYPWSEDGDVPQEAPDVARTLLGDVDAERVEAPWGPTLRVRRVEAAESGPGEDWLGATLTEHLTYLTTPPGLEGFTVLDAVWVDVVLGDAIAAYVDDLVGHLDLEFQQ